MRRSCLVVIAVAACGGASRPDAKPPLAPPSVKLVEPGAEPRQHVKFDAKARTTERFEITTKMRLAMSVENTARQERQRTSEMPTIHIRGRIDVVAIRSDGEALVSLATDDITVDDDADPRTREAVDDELYKNGNIHGTWTRSPNGRTYDVEMAEDGLHARGVSINHVNDSLVPATVVFPDEPIGVGATWVVTSQERTGRLLWDQTMTCTLRSLEDGFATVDVSLASRAGAQVLVMEPTRSRVSRATLSGSGQVIVPLHGVVPSATIHGTSEVTFRAMEGRGQSNTTLSTDALISINPLRAGEPVQASSNSATTGR